MHRTAPPLAIPVRAGGLPTIPSAERSVVALSDAEQVNPDALAYINRLSDLLFVAARFVASSQGGDVLWQPGATR